MHLFSLTNLYDEIYKWFNIIVDKDNELEAFVIMPNHLHLLIFINENENINKLLANGKRFLAYEIVKRLELQKQHDILEQLQLAVTAKEKQRQKKHRAFEISSDIKPCYTEKFLPQKLNYIHNNPVMPKWKLANQAEEYFHSSEQSASVYTINTLDGCRGTHNASSAKARRCLTKKHLQKFFRCNEARSVEKPQSFAIFSMKFSTHHLN